MLLLLTHMPFLVQGASKTNIALIVTDDEASAAVRGLHREFFEPPN